MEDEKINYKNLDKALDDLKNQKIKSILVVDEDTAFIGGALEFYLDKDSNVAYRTKKVYDFKTRIIGNK